MVLRRKQALPNQFECAMCSQSVSQPSLLEGRLAASAAQGTLQHALRAA